MNRYSTVHAVFLVATLLSLPGALTSEKPSTPDAVSENPRSGFAFQRTENQLAITFGGRPVGEYVFRDPKIPRPYLTRLHASDGTQVTRNHPPVKGQDPVDHDTVHPGLWLAFGDLNGVDFWRNRGRIDQAGFTCEPKSEANRLSFAAELRYVGPDGKEVCRGTNEYCFVAGSTLQPHLSGTLILFAAELRGGGEPLRFGPQHEMGLGIRVASPLMVKGSSGTILGSHGGKNEAGNWGRAGTWWDYSGSIGDRRTGVLLAAAGNNPRRVWSHARDYGFLAMNPTGAPLKLNDNEPSVPFSVAKGEALRMKFAVLLHSQPVAETWDASAASKAVFAALEEWQPESWAGRPKAPANGKTGQNAKPADEILAVRTFECMDCQRWQSPLDGSGQHRAAAEESTGVGPRKPTIQDAQAGGLDDQIVLHQADDLVEERDRFPGGLALAPGVASPQ